MTYRDEVLHALGTNPGGEGFDEVVGFKVPRRLLRVTRWTGDRPFSLSDDCRKQGSLLLGPDGQMSCMEVEVGRLLRTQWQAGWVQGFPCGGLRWGESIWKTLPEPIGVINERVQAARGQRRVTTFSGHPDVAVTDGSRVVYIECKMEDNLKPSQIEWFGEAVNRKIIGVGQVLVVHGVARPA